MKASFNPLKIVIVGKYEKSLIVRARLDAQEWSVSICAISVLFRRYGVD